MARIGCHLAQEDTALDTILTNESWSHLLPLKACVRSGVSCGSQATD